MADNMAHLTQVHILTLNCWGIRYVSREYSRRLNEIGRSIANADPIPDIVGLQECFSREAFECIRREIRSILPYAKHYSAGSFGAGLAILSRWPFEETSMIRYPLNGCPIAFYHGDWYVGKGVACATIRYGEAPDNVIEVLNTHMHAYYSDERDYLCHRVGQAWEFAKLLRAASQRRQGKALVIGLGDFNTTPNSLPWRVLMHRAPDMRDSWLENPLRKVSLSANGEPASNAQDELSGLLDGATYGSPYNTWHWTRDQRSRYLAAQTDTPTSHQFQLSELDQSQIARIDYILANVVSQLLDTASLEAARGESGSQNTSKAKEHGRGVWVVKAAKVGMRDLHPTLNCSLSDHFSVEATLAFVYPHGLGLVAPSDARIDSRQNTSADVLPGAAIPQTAENGEALLDEILHVLGDYQLARRRQSRWRKWRVGVEVTVLIGSMAGVWVVSEHGWARFLLGNTGALALAVAALDGFGGMLFDLAEGSALRELAWEVRNAKERGLC